MWFIATGLFVILCYIPDLTHEYLCFVAAAFVSSIVLMVFSAVWGNRITNAIACSLILWSLAAMLFAFLYLFTPFEVLIILWFVFRKVK